MPRVALDDLEPGMILSRAAMNENGAVLINENTELNDSLIEKLKTAKVESIYIKGVSKPVIPIDEALFSIDKRFKPVQDKPYMNLIKRVLEEYTKNLYE